MNTAAASSAAARYVAASGSGIPEGLSPGGLTDSTVAGGSNGTAAATATAAAVAASAAAARYAAATTPVTPGDRLKPLTAPYVQLMQSNSEAAAQCRVCWKGGWVSKQA